MHRAFFPRSDFPVFQATDTVWLDAAATTQKPSAVLEAMHAAEVYGSAPIHRGLYDRAEELTAAYEEARSLCATWIGMPRESVVVTSGATMGIHAIVHAWAARMLKPGDRIVIPAFEHHANHLPWLMLAQQTGARVAVIPVRDDTCALVSKDIMRIIDTTAKIVVCATHTNTFGPVPRETLLLMARQARAQGAALVLDATQMMLHRDPQLLRELDPDFLVFSGHKMCGPSGVGVLAVSPRRFHELRPWLVGGGTVEYFSGSDVALRGMPALLEAGTPPIAPWIGLGAAIRYLQSRGAGSDAAIAHEASLVRHVLDGLQGIPGCRVLGSPGLLRSEGHLVTFAISGVHAHDIASALGARNIAVRAGNHCCQPLHEALGLSATVRVSCAPYTSHEDIARFLCVLHDVHEQLKTM